MDKPQTTLQTSSSVNTNPSSRNRVHLNQNFILVPATNTNLLANNGSVTNLIATHHNSIVNKGKIMILTTAPQVGQTSRIATSTTSTCSSSVVGQLPRQTSVPLNSSNATVTINNNTNMINISNIKVNSHNSVTSNSNVPISLTDSGTKTPAIQVLPNSAVKASKLNAAALNKYFTKSTISLYSNNCGLLEKNIASASTSNTVQHKSLSSTASDNIVKQTNEKESRCETELIDLDSEQDESAISNDMDLIADESLLETELKEIENKSHGIIHLPKEIKLQSDETLDQSSPDLWPEPVPGVIKFLANTMSPLDCDDDTMDSTDKTETKSAATSIKVESTDDENSVHLTSFGQASSVKKYTKSFSITPYGLETNMKHIATNNSDNQSTNDDSTCTSPTESTSTVASKLSKSKDTTKLPEWQKGLSEEEVLMLHGYGSLTASSLLEKVKEIQNLAYQLGLEEEREITRACFLNILNDPVSMEDDITGNCNHDIGNLFTLEELEKVSGS